ncbi:MAG TPA: hypothetical protein VFI76_05620, partial [Terrimicrobiaceae bacterium]|nr:hypothetical protein [Terrimicrobiaceae bacterium]
RRMTINDGKFSSARQHHLPGHRTDSGKMFRYEPFKTRGGAHSKCTASGLVIGHMHGTFIHVPIEMLTRELKRIDPEGILRSGRHLVAGVLAATGTLSGLDHLNCGA